MKHKTMTKINKVLAIVLILCFSTPGIAETINPATIDASGPALTPARNSLLDALGDKKCSIIDWDENGRIIEPGNPKGADISKLGNKARPILSVPPHNDDVIHSFDRPKDFEGTYVLQDLVEQLSAKAKLEGAEYEDNGTLGGYHFVTDKMKFADKKVIDEAKALGYLRNVPSRIDRNGDGKYQDIPAANTTYILPTSCGTFLFVKYEARCITNKRMVAIGTSHYEVTQYDESIPNDPGRTFSDAWVLTNYYNPMVSSDAIAGEIYDRYWEPIYSQLAFILQTVQTGLELHPFGSMVSTVVKMVYARIGVIDPISTADKWGMRGDIILEAMPIISQAQRARKYSKQIFVVGSGAILATQVARQASLGTWKPELQDVLRLVVYGVTGFQMKAFSLKWNSVTNKFEPNLAVNDGHKGLEALGVTNQTAVAAAVNQVGTALANKPNFNQIKQMIKGIVDSFQTRRNIAVVDEEDVLVDALKIGGTPADFIYRYRRGLIKLVYQKVYGEFNRIAADGFLNTLKTHLTGAGKHIFPVTVTLNHKEWTKILNARNHAKLKMESQFDIHPNTKEWKEEMNKLMLQGMEGDLGAVRGPIISESIGTRVHAEGPHYSAAREDVYYAEFDGNFPTHYTVDPSDSSIRTYFLSSQQAPPNAIPTDFSLPGIDNGHVRDSVEAVFKYGNVEEISHAVPHHGGPANTQKGTTPSGHYYEVTGIGMPAQIRTVGNSNLGAFAMLPQSIHTPNIMAWIETLSLADIRNILISRGSRHAGLVDTELREMALDIMELDTFLLAYETRGFLTKNYRNQYVVRTLAEHAFETGVVTLMSP